MLKQQFTPAGHNEKEKLKLLLEIVVENESDSIGPFTPMVLHYWISTT